MGLAEHREAYRYPTDFTADCRMAADAWTSRLCNISTTGCMMVCPEGGLPAGWMLRLRIRGLPAIDAEIIWKHRGHAGLRFLVALHPTALEHLGFRLPEPRRPAYRPDPENPPGPPLRPAFGGLRAELVKRTPPDEGLQPGIPSQVRGAPQPLS
jgi:hypothetical protein